MKHWHRIFKHEEGLALPLTLVMLVVGASFVIPVLALVTTGLNFNRTVEENTRALYSADAGIEKAIWEINEALKTGLPQTVLPTEEGNTISLPDLPSELIDVNGMSQVTTTVTNKGSQRFQITATATNARNGHQTVVDCYIYLFGLASLAEGAITSNRDIKVNNCIVKGGVNYNGSLTFNSNHDPDGFLITKGHPSYPVLREQYWWPNTGELRDFYYSSTTEVVTGDTLNVEDYAATGILPSFYWNGDLYGGTLKIWNKDKSVPELKLGGNLCIDGSLDVHGPQPFRLNLNGKTIFVRDEFSCQPGRIETYGHGAIISGGRLNFQPAFVTDPLNPGDPVYIYLMSVDDEAYLKPSRTEGDVWGCVLGWKLVQCLNASIQYVDPSGYELDFPDIRPMIMTYEIK